uniref:riboflavin kinase n=1 Tax=Parastrongyloides trichosuri TaxID=131310 RepID=A0A0N4Z114_PARTI
MTTSKFDLPVYFKGTVVHGHGRGGKRLNCPTANLSPETIKQLPHNFPNGVYCGLAKVNDDDLLPMVMSYGDNPYFKDVEKTLEVHILHQYPSDFYSAKLACVVLYHIRPMSSFSTVEELIMAIEGDKTFACKILSNVNLDKYRSHSIFK